MSGHGKNAVTAAIGGEAAEAQDREHDKTTAPRLGTSCWGGWPPHPPKYVQHGTCPAAAPRLSTDKAGRCQGHQSQAGGPNCSCSSSGCTLSLSAPTSRRGRRWSSRRRGCTRTGHPAWPGPPWSASTPCHPCSTQAGQASSCQGQLGQEARVGCQQGRRGRGR